MFGERIPASAHTRVKICGITNLEDGLAALEFGADALGFNFYPGSKRFIKIADASKWIGELPSSTSNVAVMVDPPLEAALEAAELPFISALQLHGEETVEFCRSLAERGVHFAKAIPVRDESSLLGAESFSTRTILLDSWSEGMFGGSGQTFAWDLAAEFVASHPELRVVLAGGLTPENVGLAVATVRPFGVDVTSGVESSPGKKDHGRMRAFIDAARTP